MNKIVKIERDIKEFFLVPFKKVCLIKNSVNFV